MTSRRDVRSIGIAAAAGALVLLLIVVAVRRHKPGDSSTRPTSKALSPTVASLTPGGTDILIGIGAASHLVGICDRDEDREGIHGLPRVGDFDHVDWEKLAAAGPQILVTQFGGRMPAGLKERCDELGIRLIDVRLDVLDDIYREADRLGAAVQEQTAEKSAVAALKSQLASIASATANLPRVRTAIAVNDGGSVGLIGPHSFHDELLAIAGGTNVAGKFGKSYVSVDPEQLMALAPEVVLDLQPTPPTTPQQSQQSRRFWASMADMPAVKNGRVYPITEPYCQQPGWHVGDLALVFAQKLHPALRR